jgi:YegS/Rv2252/BmrU family lipid kinase
VRVAVIINPASGRRGRRADAGAARQAIARRVLDARSIDATIAVTQSPGHARELARQFVEDGFDRVVAWGGDGTINEVAGPVLGTQAALGIVPAGSGNGFARGLRLPSRPEHALAAAIEGGVVRLDVGWFGARHFLNAAGVGFDATVAHAFSRRERRGLAGYLTAGFGSVASYRAATYTLELDGARSTGPRFMVAFGNGREYGNGFVIAPDADPADGYLDAVIVADGSIVRQLWRARRLLIRPASPEPGIERVRIRRGRISGPDQLMAHVDGEPVVTPGPVDVRVAPGALALVMPPGPAAAG